MKKIFLLLSIINLIYAGEYKVKRITDGDTIVVLKKEDLDIKENEIKVRLAFIDTMESIRNNRAKKIANVCDLDLNTIIIIGKESKNTLSNIIKNKEVNIIFHGLDDLNKRYIGEIYLDNDNTSINEKMLEIGQALPYYKYIRQMDPENMDYYIYLFNKNRHNAILDNHCLNKKLGI